MATHPVNTMNTENIREARLMIARCLADTEAVSGDYVSVLAGIDELLAECEPKQMTVHLLNSAMMPAGDGKYNSCTLTREEFAKLARQAHDEDKLISYVGYKQTAEILSDLCGFEVVENRKETIIEDGDILLIARIKYRLANRMGRDAKPSIDDLEFRIVTYSAI